MNIMVIGTGPVASTLPRMLRINDHNVVACVRNLDELETRILECVLDNVVVDVALVVTSDLTFGRNVVAEFASHSKKTKVVAVASNPAYTTYAQHSYDPTDSQRLEDYLQGLMK